MELLQTRDKKFADPNHIHTFKEYIMTEARNQNVQFIKKKVPLEAIIGAGVTLLFLIIFYLLKNQIPVNFGTNDTIFRALITFAPLVIGLSITSGRASKTKAHNRRQVERFESLRYQVLIDNFNLRYEDIKIVSRLSHQEIASALVPRLVSVYTNLWINGRSHDSCFHKAYGGYVFQTKNNVILKMFEIEVRETHYDSDGDQYFKYRNYICTIIENFPPRWTNIGFVIDEEIEKRRTLENDKFNKMWGYYFHDEINLRRLLTPWVQEQLVNAKFKFTFKNTNNVMHWYGRDYRQIMISNFKLASTLDETIYNMSKDVLVDLANIESLIQDLSIYKTIIF